MRNEECPYNTVCILSETGISDASPIFNTKLVPFLSMLLRVALFVCITQPKLQAGQQKVTNTC